MAEENVLPKLVGKVYDQLTAIRDSGQTNMFDVVRVKQLAIECNYVELAKWLGRVSAEVYCYGILYGFERL